MSDTIRPGKMSQRDFWTLIDTLDGQAHHVEALIDALSTQRPGRILAFADVLARRLHALDRYELFTQPVREPDQTAHTPTIPLTEDGFLYARCAVVAAGQYRYEQVLADPTTFAGTWDTDGEALLNAAPAAWARVTSTPWEHEEPVSYESGSNASGGWPDPEDDAKDTERPLVNLHSTSWLNTTRKAPAGKRFYRSVGTAIIETAPLVQAEAETLLREHGGWPDPVRYAALWFAPADYWDWQLERHQGPVRWDQRDDTPGQPQYTALTITINKDETLTWSPQQNRTGLRALVAYMLLAQLSAVDPAHGALPALRSWLHEADDLLPHLCGD